MSVARRGAIIGFGNVAEKGHLPGWLEARDFEIVAVADPVPARRAQAEHLIPGIRSYSSYNELLAREQVDFVDIASPPAFHPDAIIAAARRGADVLCEKPLTTRIDAYRPVRRAVDDAGVLLHVVHNWKYSEAFLALDEILAGGRMGRLKSVLFETRRNGWAASDDDWRIKRTVAGGGILVDHGWHNFYLILTLAASDPLAITATLDRVRYVDADIEDTAICRIDFAKLRAEIRLTWAASARRTRWELTAERGRIVIDDDRIEVETPVGIERRRLASGLSAGSHHADWFPGVIESFRRELNDRQLRGTNRREAEWCLVLLDRAYAAAGGELTTLPSPAAILVGR
jgi:predicted dehydrogenase